MPIIITVDDIGGCTCVGDVLEVHTPNFGGERFYFTYEMDGEVVVYHAHKSKVEAFDHYQALRHSVGPIGMSDIKSTREEMENRAAEIGLSCKFVLHPDDQA